MHSLEYEFSAGIEPICTDGATAYQQQFPNGKHALPKFPLQSDNVSEDRWMQEAIALS